MFDIVRELKKALAAGKKAAITTIVDTAGSVYRREGARAVIHEDGAIAGMVSGGCVESDLSEYAREVWEKGVGMRVPYDFRAENDLIWGLGVGCNGALTTWIFPFDPIGHRDVAKAIVEEFERRRTTHTLYRVGWVVESADPARFPEGAVVELAEPLPWGLVERELDGCQVLLFVEEVVPRPQLVVYGAGPDAVPLVEQARVLDWSIHVYDHRPQMATKMRFPAADKVQVIDRTEYGTQDFPTNETFVVVMTHNYELDRNLLEHLLPQPLPYLGLLGPRALGTDAGRPTSGR